MTPRAQHQDQWVPDTLTAREVPTASLRACPPTARVPWPAGPGREEAAWCCGERPTEAEAGSPRCFGRTKCCTFHGRADSPNLSFTYVS